MSLFSADGITAGYGKRNVISDISFELESGQLLGILGANGSGKTTLLKAICGIIPHTGSCTVDGVVLDNLPPAKLARLCGYIPQRSGISIDIPVIDTVLMGFNPYLGILGHPDKAMKERAMLALREVGLDGMADVNYQHLSEGQKQLCILARTLVADTRVMLLDEPESALDFRYRRRMLELLKIKTTGSDRCVIISLHDPALALNYCDRLMLIHDGGVLGMFSPKADGFESAEAMLSVIYGNVSLNRVFGRNGGEHIVMIGEDE